MKLAIIGASYLQLPAYIKAREMGFETIGFAWKDGAVAKDYCDYFYPISIVEKELILEVCKKEKIDGILSIASDVAVTTVNYVASKLGLFSNSIESALCCTNKYLMREKLQAAGLNCPRYRLIANQSNVMDIANDINFPTIVKPVDRSGSMGIKKVHDVKEFVDATAIALKASLSGQAIVEDFVEGVEVSVESISFNGEHHILTITDKVTSGEPHFVELEHHQPSLLPQAIQNQININTRKALSALDIKYGASHSEFLISKKKIYITEVGARLGGDFIGSDLVLLSTGYDLLRGTIEVAMGKFSPPVKTIQKSSGVYFYSEQTKNVGEIIKENKYPLETIKAEIQNERLMPLTQSADRSGYLIYQSNSRLLL